MRDLFSRERFCKKISSDRLPVVICRHQSLIRRQLGNVDMALQENKAVNLALAAPEISGVVIEPGETFSLWHLVGKTSASRGYKEGLMIRRGVVDRGIGGGLCQLSNLIHWLVLHTPLEITEHHHHDGVDLFPDFGRQVPFGVGTSISYNYLDYRFTNCSDRKFQLIVYTGEKYLAGEIRSDEVLEEKYHIRIEDEFFRKIGEKYFRCGKVIRDVIDKKSGRITASEVIKNNFAEVCYDVRFIPPEKLVGE
jgi:vancomycin resistance protein VanW